MKAIARIGAMAVGLGALTSPTQGQTPSGSDPAGLAMRQWLQLVAGDGADRAWAQASFRFQYRVTESDWRSWVGSNHARLAEGAAGRRVVEFTLGRDEAPLPVLDWARAVFARNRPDGGRLLERLVAVNEGGTWRIADFAVWPDGAAIVASAGIDPVPYHIAYNGVFLHDPEWRFHPRAYRPPRPAPVPPAPPPTNFVNPRTTPRKPPPG